MKRIILLLLLLMTFVDLVHGTDIAFILNGQKAVVQTGALENIKLPLKLIFSDQFDGKKIAVTDPKGKVIAQQITQFGAGDLQKDGETGAFLILIDTDRTFNPGTEKLGSDTFIIKTGNASFSITLSNETAVPPKKPNADPAAPYQAGYIYYDAIALSQALHASTVDREKIQLILHGYGINALNIEQDKFLYSVFPADIFDGVQGTEAASFLGNLGNTDVTYFAAGLARFLAERTKEELNEAFFSKMKAELNAYPELKTLFPKTTSFLNIIETYAYASVLQVLKEAFETDMQNLAENLYNIKNLTKADCDGSLLKDTKLADCQTRLGKLEDFFKTRQGRWTGLGMFTVKEAETANNPAALLDAVATSTELKDLKAKCASDTAFVEFNIATSIELTNFISHSLMSKNDNQIWINGTELNALLNDRTALKIYLGLLYAYEKMQPGAPAFYIKNSGYKTFGDILNQLQPNYQLYETNLSNLIKNVHGAFNSANSAVKKMLSAGDKSMEADPQALYDYYKTFSTSFKTIATHPFIAQVIQTDLSPAYNKIQMYIDPTVDIAYHIATKKYSAALYDAVSLLDNINAQAFDRPVIKSMIKYGTLISTMANAQSSDEVKKALEASVLPVGSASIKRNTNWSISINAYVGGYWGKAHTHRWDTLTNASTHMLDSTKRKVSYSTFGLYAPIGVSFSKGSKSGWGLSVTAQIIDLGALVNFYMLNDDQTALPSDFKVRLSNIFAPGAQLALNFPKVPISLTCGTQYVPSLYKVDQVNSDTQIIGTTAWRTHVSLVVDLPLYNIKVWDFKK